MNDNQSNEKIAHLGMIQGLISRFASTSLAIKGLSAALITTALLVTKDFDYKLVIALIGITLLLSFFDAKYLKLEREYRKLYDRVAKKTEVIDYSMCIEEGDKTSFPDTYFSWSVWLYYLLLSAAPLVFWLIK